MKSKFSKKQLAHFDRLRKLYANPTSHPQWKGGRIIRQGYIFIKKKGHPNANDQGYVAEHRYVMAEHIGRSLKKREVVHHIDGDPQNNNIENLQLFESPGKHTAEAHPEIYEKQSIIFKGKRFSPKTEFKKVNSKLSRCNND